MLLLLHVEGQPFVQAVALDDQSDPSYIANYAETVRRYLPDGVVLRAAAVDVTHVAEYGPNDVAMFLTVDGQERVGVPDLPQRWEVVGSPLVALGPVQALETIRAHVMQMRNAGVAPSGDAILAVASRVLDEPHGDRPAGYIPPARPIGDPADGER